LRFRPELLADYPCVVIVGHDEYWSHEMRTTIERWVDEGGSHARFRANFVGQIRLEDNGQRRIYCKGRAAAEDPVRSTADARLLTPSWEDPQSQLAGCDDRWGVYCSGGIDASCGGFTPRGQRGITAYRTADWTFDRTDLHYRDTFGAEAWSFGYELDSLDQTFRRVLPYPFGSDGAPASVQLLGMAPAMNAETGHAAERFRSVLQDKDLKGGASTLLGSTSPENLDERRYGSDMFMHTILGKGWPSSRRPLTQWRIPQVSICAPWTPGTSTVSRRAARDGVEGRRRNLGICRGVSSPRNRGKTCIRTCRSWRRSPRAADPCRSTRNWVSAQAWRLLEGHRRETYSSNACGRSWRAPPDEGFLSRV
jgi:hypothetical protein